MSRVISAIAATVITMAALPSASKASTPGVTGNDWLHLCESKNDVDAARCFTFARSVADTLIFMLEADKAIPACIPVEADANQLVDLGVQFMVAHTKERHHGAASLLAYAFWDAFPCDEANKPTKQ